jgi:hypothetical protein
VTEPDRDALLRSERGAILADAREDRVDFDRLEVDAGGMSVKPQGVDKLIKLINQLCNRELTAPQVFAIPARIDTARKPGMDPSNDLQRLAQVMPGHGEQDLAIVTGALKLLRGASVGISLISELALRACACDRMRRGMGQTSP